MVPECNRFIHHTTHTGWMERDDRVRAREDILLNSKTKSCPKNRFTGSAKSAFLQAAVLQVVNERHHHPRVRKVPNGLIVTLFT